jgi:hypothetical protein
MTEAKISVDVRGIPELVWSCRCELANVLRQEAEAEGQNCLVGI